jgi:pyrroline-5-carboxylate reductase
MPNNTPLSCLVGQGAAGYALGSHAIADDRTLVETNFGSCGTAAELPELLLNAVTGLCGSGTAYVFHQGTRGWRCPLRIASSCGHAIGADRQGCG